MPEGNEGPTVYGTFSYVMFALVAAVLIGSVLVGGAFALDQARQ